MIFHATHLGIVEAADNHVHSVDLQARLTGSSIDRICGTAGALRHFVEVPNTLVGSAVFPEAP